MSNIYEAPVSKLDDEPGVSDDSHKFYVVSPVKFILLYTLTFGFYKIYWFYKNWSRYKAQTQEDMWPVMRGIFTIFFAHSLVRQVNDTIGEEPREYSWDPELLATSYVAAQVGMAVMDRLPKATNWLVIPLEIFAVFPLIGFLLYRVQRAINVACGDPLGTSNSKLSLANFVWMFIGLILIVLALVGAFVDLPES